MNIAVVGTGYVGLVTGTCFAETGNHVVCIDIDASKVERMQRGEIPIYEPHLENLFQRNIRQGRLSFTTKLEDGIRDAAVIFLALPTPPGEDGSADLRHVLDVAQQLGTLLKNYTIVINKSTVPVGTAEKVQEVIRAARKQQSDFDFDVVSNPEFLREGFAVDDFMKPDRVVIGTRSEKAKKILTELYAPFVRQGNPVYFMDERSSELTKYAANAFLATKISFMNEIAALCEKTGANVDAIRVGIGADDRIGKRFLFAGIGYGGSCFPKDVKALIKIGEQAGSPFQILHAVEEVNAEQRVRLMEKIRQHYPEGLAGKKAALWGLAFKPDTDDIREAPALYLIDALIESGATVAAFDPEAIDNARGLKRASWHGRVAFGTDEYEILRDADFLIIATEWSLFRAPDFPRIASLMKSKTLFDGRNLYDLAAMEDLGFYYASVGRNTIGT